MSERLSVKRLYLVKERGFFDFTMYYLTVCISYMKHSRDYRCRDATKDI